MTSRGDPVGFTILIHIDAETLVAPGSSTANTVLDHGYALRCCQGFQNANQLP